MARPEPDRDEICRRFGIDASEIPRHIALILDGNGRWASRRGLHRTEGHRRGEPALWDVVEGGLALGVEWMTVYVFSTENWTRPPEEVEFLLWFNRDILLRRREECLRKGIRIRFMGRRAKPVPRALVETIEESEALTAGCRKLNLTFAFNYGGRAEIVDAVREVAADAVAGRIDPRRITERTIARHLYVPEMPDPDLLIRSSGEMRISNFLLWQSAYAEFLFPRRLWPDFRRRHLYEAVARYQNRDRRYGGVND